MLKFILIGLIGGASSLSMAQGADIEFKEVVVNEVTRKAVIDLNEETVLCSSADYGALFLKVLIPQLKDITLLDHRNEGAGAPCVAAGLCRGPQIPTGNAPEDILNPEKPTQKIKINVRLVRMNEINRRDFTCQVTLREEIKTKIRGVEFSHQRFASLGERNYQDCL